jgi:hypothetical protein
MRLVQLSGEQGRRVAAVEDARLRLLAGAETIYALAMEGGAPALSGETLDYDEVYTGRSGWRLLPPIDHPEPARCLVSGTGLTHIRSAANRQAMHAADEHVTDSMRMYQWGVEGGRPAPGVAPEWFYKGTGWALRGHNDPLDIPGHAEDGGEEPEIAGVYIIDADGTPRRIGMAGGNEFSDHVLEKRNYLYLAASKLRTCSIGPELVLDPDFRDVRGEVSIERNGAVVWAKAIRSGEAAMCHSLANLEHHHFKFDGHRRPGDVHVHFFGADAFSFGEGVRLEEGDWMQVRWDGFGRPLRHVVRKVSGERVVEERGA